ncbi:MAG: aldehyde dehydrogenase family protein [Deltaproteobacteria bacterium]|nr:MAG: aldehyde dehydrogenase family protein [Deltaproteobacteria bacterium]
MTENPTVLLPAMQDDMKALREAAPVWTGKLMADIVPYLEACKERVMDVAEAWVNDAAQAKGLPEGSPLRGEEWTSGPWAVLAHLNAYIHTLSSLAQGDNPFEGQPIRTTANGRTAVRVFPAHHWDQLLLNGYSAEVWQQSDVNQDNLLDNIAERFYSTVEPKVSLILGAGNINSIPALDALYKLIAEGEVCLIKLNPINHYLKAHFDHIFAPFIEEGFIRIVNGGGSVGATLCQHDGIDTIHITGSAYTHDLIVFGTGEEGAERKADNNPLNPRPISSELGGVGPTLVVPGPWNSTDIVFQAEHLITQKLHNAGCNCIASQVLVLPDEWEGTDRLLHAIRDTLPRVLGRPAYYTGSEKRIAEFQEAYPNAEVHSTDPTFLLIDNLDPEADEFCFREEAFGQVWGIVRLPGADPASFLANAVTFANEKLYGTLGCQMVIHPSTQSQYKDAFEQALADLNYGTIGVNAWSGVGFLIPNAMWGAFPGHPLNDVQSGIGVVHNGYLFDKPEKTVVYAPFQMFPRTVARGQLHLSPKPMWLVTHSKGERAGKYLTEFEATRNIALVPPLFWAALTG